MFPLWATSPLFAPVKVIVPEPLSAAKGFSQSGILLKASKASWIAVPELVTFALAAISTLNLKDSDVLGPFDLTNLISISFFVAALVVTGK